MIGRDELERRLSLARTGFEPPDAALGRVRARLSPAPEAAGPSRAGAGARWRSGGVASPVVVLLMGASLAVGYFWGRGVEPFAAAPRAAAPPAAAAPHVGDRSVLGERSGAPTRLDPQPATSPPAVGARAADVPAVATVDAGGDAPAVAALDVPAVAASRRAASAPRIEPPASGLAKSRGASPASVAADTAAARLDELSLLARAERAIRASEPALALALLDELDQRHPRSSLLEERAAARVVARCTLSPGEHREGAERFLQANAASVYTDRIRRACAPGQANGARPDASREGSSVRGH